MDRDLPTLEDRAARALESWNVEGVLHPVPDAGLINHSWFVQPAGGRADSEPRGVLQWVAPIFDPSIHEDIDAVTARLASQGLETPRLVPTRTGALFVDGGDVVGVWRLLTYVPGTTRHRVDRAATAAAAGRLVGRFHGVLAGWDYSFKAPARRIHATARRMADLEQAMSECVDHPLAGGACGLGERVLTRWNAWEGTLDLPERPTHGDLKISNLRFRADDNLRSRADNAGEQAVALIDLDTLGRLPLAVEMGDAWRSWCNRAGEDEPEACALDLELFEASARAWLERFEATAGPLPREERESLVPGIERIALELAARFCTDALRNVYFREDRVRFPEIGRHNLERARGQLNLAIDARSKRAECEAIVLAQA